MPEQEADDGAPDPLARVRQQNLWFSAQFEDALETELPICDPHHHLWEHPGNRYLMGEYLADCTLGHRVVSSVHVECVSKYRSAESGALSPVGETEFVERQARAGLCAGIVGFADLRLGDAVAEVLDAHLTATKCFRGVRYATAWDAHPEIREAHTRPGPSLLCSPAFRRGYAQLSRRGLSFDAWVFHPQIGEIEDLAWTFPDTAIVVDHMGGPLGIGPYADRRDEVFAAWSNSIRRLARCPNVYMKLGGIHMPLNGWHWHRRDQPPGSEELVRVTGHYYRHAIDCFGPDRCMFESNFPADRVSVSWVVLWNTFKRIAQSFTLEERAALFHDTATRFYRLT